ncbi:MULTISPECIES: histidinol dehydrogenase [Empedobacter]|uniref:histidinol dehydrogenase n=1 Tax=Empedobacter TaxID=59734 RepID=UPI001C585B43|nr:MULTISPECIES: histidinol dehydrogenase [Empedobacter]MBW1617545.1 histidinol dehydrogenase [Empedobacter falsenii]MBY0065910.1 histidinol dehydrogenase [Empedobacter falsenii]MDH1602469.1 histidinol dehydrogenase [Empedobacter sp. GD03739]
MQTYIKPQLSDWSTLTARPTKEAQDLQEIVLDIFGKIQTEKDQALIDFTEKFDQVKLTSLEVSTQEIEEAKTLISEELKGAIQLAASNIEKFHTEQREEVKVIETTKGVNCWRESRGIENVGIYIPGGTAPLFSTTLMLGIPAKLAGCQNIILCTPPNKEGKIHPAILYTANLIGIEKIYKVGGIQAIGTLTFGTETIQKVDKIFGPGNQYVTAAKQVAQNFGVAIDMPAGPSEVLVIADETSVPKYVAADLLSQAEHGIDSQVILLTTNEQILNETIEEINAQLEVLPRKELATKALENSKGIVLNSIEECVTFSNIYAPEHLIFACEMAENYIDKIINVGSVFLGNYSCESAGDYASGTNHTLPTNGYAKNYSGVSFDSFIKKITFQKLSAEGIQNIGPAIELMAEAEELFAHKNAVTLRLNDLKS